LFNEELHFFNEIAHSNDIRNIIISRPNVSIAFDEATKKDFVKESLVDVNDFIDTSLPKIN
jgi:hypothetical protein